MARDLACGAHEGPQRRCQGPQTAARGARAEGPRVNGNDLWLVRAAQPPQRRRTQTARQQYQ